MKATCSLSPRGWLSTAWLLGALVVSLAGIRPVQSCTTFLLKGEHGLYFGRNLDWDWEDGLVVVNPRGLQKTSLVAPPNTPVRWVAKYGSLTFNQLGRELPYGGMNEAGLVVENMWLDATQYPAPDSRPAINLLQWIQYQLDTCRTVAEVLAHAEDVRMEPPPPAVRTTPRIHYLVCDETGDCATIEFLGGKLVCHRGTNLPCCALANDTYEDSLAYAKTHPERRTARGRLKDPTSPARFTRAAARVAGFRSKSVKADLNYAFKTLDEVCQPGYTVWSIVYDIRGRQIHYRTRSQPQERSLDLKQLDFSCAQPAQCLDIQATPSQRRALKFQELTPALHREYLERFFTRPAFQEKFGDLRPLMEGLLQLVGTYTCASSSPATAAATEVVKHVDAGQAQQLVTEKKVIVIDVRTPEEFQAGRIAGAKNIDFTEDDFEQKLAKLDRRQAYLVHCASGGRSSQSLAIFKKLQFESIYHLDGGLGAWQRAGLPVEK